MYSIEVCTSSGGINTFLPGWQLSFGEQAGEISYRDTFASHPGLLWMYADMNNPFKVPPFRAAHLSGRREPRDPVWAARVGETWTDVRSDSG